MRWGVCPSVLFGLSLIGHLSDHFEDYTMSTSPTPWVALQVHPQGWLVKSASGATVAISGSCFADHREHNMRLIAAAPDLLAMLQYLLDGNIVDSLRTPVIHRRCLEVIRRATLEDT